MCERMTQRKGSRVIIVFIEADIFPSFLSLKKKNKLKFFLKSRFERKSSSEPEEKRLPIESISFGSAGESFFRLIYARLSCSLRSLGES